MRTDDLKQERSSLTPTRINTRSHVKLWIGREALPDKHRARFAKLRQDNPDATIHLIYSAQYLSNTEQEKLQTISKELDIELVDIASIRPRNEVEARILKHIHHEIRFFFEQADHATKGNMSVVSDQLRLLSEVIEMGIMSDCDVEFNSALAEEWVEAPLGFIARQKENGTRVSNDLTTGDAQCPVFVTARALVDRHNQLYHECVARYFIKHSISFNPDDYENHPQYYKARNQQLRQFSLGGGPQLFALALHLCGVATGYEETHDEILLLNEDLSFTPYDFASIISESVRQHDFEAMFPAAFGYVISHWDTSWMPDQTAWRTLTLEEEARLKALRERQPERALTVQKYEYQAPLFRTNGVLTFGRNSAFHIPDRVLRQPSSAALILSHLHSPQRLGARTTPFSALCEAEQRYIRENETPDALIRNEMLKALGDDFGMLAKELDEDGLLIITDPKIQAEARALYTEYQQEISKKRLHPAHAVRSFSVAADTVNQSFRSAAYRLGSDPRLQALIRYHFGCDVKLTAMRGYETETIEPFLFRAWDWHHDNKSQGAYGEIKVMVLLNGVGKYGQAMRYVRGSHKNHWRSQSLRETKFNCEEIADFAAKANGISLCWGDAGTIIIFDTNGAHSGWRNLSHRRDVITITYTPNREALPVMFNVDSEAREVDNHGYLNTVGLWSEFRRSARKEVLNDSELASLLHEHARTPTLESMKARFQGEFNREAFNAFLLSVAECDINADLDLEVRMDGRTVIERDNQLVKFRDVSHQHPQYQRLSQRLERLNFSPTFALSNEILEKIARAIATIHLSNSSADMRSCQLFAADLAEAFSRVDSLQRARTQSLYLYFTLDRLCELNNENSTLNQMADQVLTMYANIVFHDDAIHSQEETSTSRLSR